MVRGGGLDLSESEDDQGGGENEKKAPDERSPATPRRTKANAAERTGFEGPLWVFEGHLIQRSKDAIPNI